MLLLYGSNGLRAGSFDCAFSSTRPLARSAHHHLTTLAQQRATEYCRPPAREGRAASAKGNSGLKRMYSPTSEQRERITGREAR